MPLNESQIEKKLDRIDAKLSAILNKPAKDHYVGVSVITEITGWKGREKLRWARDNGLVEYDRKKGYKLSSIPEIFIKK